MPLCRSQYNAFLFSKHKRYRYCLNCRRSKNALFIFVRVFTFFIPFLVFETSTADVQYNHRNHHHQTQQDLAPASTTMQPPQSTWWPTTTRTDHRHFQPPLRPTITTTNHHDDQPTPSQPSRWPTTITTYSPTTINPFHGQHDSLYFLTIYTGVVIHSKQKTAFLFSSSLTFITSFLFRSVVPLQT